MKINDTNDVLVWLRTIDERRRSHTQLSGALSTCESAVLLAATNTPANNQQKEQYENKPN